MENSVMVAAIDFGTTFSGYAFSFQTSPEDIKMNKNWGEGLGFQSYKTPTCVLVNGQGEFDSFGYEAEDKYGKLIENEGAAESQWSLYKEFKMLLHKHKKLSRTHSISSTNGVIRPAIEIFVMSLKYLKDHILATLSKQLKSAPDASAIRWVLTVPAIWTDKSKSFMREAAYEAGLMTSKDSKQLVIALEPEAASLFCRRLNLAEFDTDKCNISFTPGTKYLVIDAGGGTVDITAHEMLTGCKVKELFVATGGAWGGAKVDANFINLLEKIFGSGFINQYQKEYPKQWLTLMVTFEKIKRSAKTGHDDILFLPLTWSFGRQYSQLTGRIIDDAIHDAEEYGVSFNNGALVIHEAALTTMFKPVTDDIVSHIEELMGNEKLHPCHYFFLVGGFGESIFLQKAIKDQFGKQVKVLIPSEAQLCVFKGAVLFGHNLDEINQRISRRTYGYAAAVNFDKAIHDPAKKTFNDSGVKCKNVFKVMVERGQIIGIGEKYIRTLRPMNAKDKKLDFTFFTIDGPPRKPVQYTDDIAVEKLGVVRVDIPNTTGGIDKKVKLTVGFGSTEIQIDAVDETTKTSFKTTLSLTS